MPLVIDAHAHVFPNPLRQWVPLTPESAVTQIRRHARSWLHPFLSPVHNAQAYLRYLPDLPRRGIEEISGVLTLPSLLLESTAEDLRDAMTEAGVDRALLIAHPPQISNEMIMEICAQDGHFIPVVNLPIGTPNAEEQLRGFAAKGAKALKIHTAQDGETQDSQYYRSLLKVAAELKLPVILHSGCFHSHALFRHPEMSEAGRFALWFQDFPEVKFVLAHMNFHKPALAMDLMQEHANVYADTSWQPTEVIAEAVRRAGSERILFGTDWPIIGNNLNVGIKRIRDGVLSGLYKDEDADRILGFNAARLFGVE